MEEPRAGSAEQVAFRLRLLERGLLLDSGVPGVYGHGAVFEDVRLRLADLLTRIARERGAERLRFPPLLPRRQLESSGAMASFPHLVGSVYAFEGDETQSAIQSARAEAHADWSAFQQMTDLALVPAACYPVYPAIAARGRLPRSGVFVDAGGAWVFRHEPSSDPTRAQIFHQHELVRIGDPDLVTAWCGSWVDLGFEILRGLGLDPRREVANDQFFGRRGRLMARWQRAQALKIELLVRIAGPEAVALASFNYHRDHFGSVYGIELGDGSVAHSACVGFGHERIVLALLSTHGLDPAAWPSAVRAALSAT